MAAPIIGLALLLSPAGPPGDTCADPHVVASLPDELASEIFGLAVEAGRTYYLVVDGSDGDCGAYTIDVTEAPPPPQCPPGADFAQPPTPPSGAWSFGISDSGFNLSSPPNTDGLIRYESWQTTGPVCGVRWWGVLGFNTGEEFVPCVEDPLEFRITFHPDVDGAPGPAACTYEATVPGTPTGQFYDGYELREWALDLAPDGCCPQTGSWIKIQGVNGNPECWFLWAGSGAFGEGLHLFDFTNGTGLQTQPFDLAVCLTAGCPWDCGDGDGGTGTADLLALLAQWGVAGGSCDFGAGDPGVDVPDFLELLANWGPCAQ